MIRIGGVNEHFNLPWILASEINNFPIEISWKSFAGGTGVLTHALRNTEIDIAILLTEGLFLDITKNKDLHFITFHVLNPLRWAIHIRYNENYGDDFSGKRFAISRMGSGSHTMAKVLLKDKLNSCTFVEVGSLEGGLKAVQNKEADIFLWEKFTTAPFLTEYELKSVGEVLTPWPPFSVACTKNFYNQNKENIQFLLREILSVRKREINRDFLIHELERRWQIKHTAAIEWSNEINWHDYSTIDNAAIEKLLQEMKNVGLLNEKDERIGVIH